MCGEQGFPSEPTPERRPGDTGEDRRPGDPQLIRRPPASVHGPAPRQRARTPPGPGAAGKPDRREASGPHPSLRELIPEFIPVVGPLDDLVVAIVALRYVRRRVGVDALRARCSGEPGPELPTGPRCRRPWRLPVPLRSDACRADHQADHQDDRDRHRQPDVTDPPGSAAAWSQARRRDHRRGLPGRVETPRGRGPVPGTRAPRPSRAPEAAGAATMGRPCPRSSSSRSCRASSPRRSSSSRR